MRKRFGWYKIYLCHTFIFTWIFKLVNKNKVYAILNLGSDVDFPFRAAAQKRNIIIKKIGITKYNINNII